MKTFIACPSEKPKCSLYRSRTVAFYASYTTWWLVKFVENDGELSRAGDFKPGTHGRQSRPFRQQSRPRQTVEFKLLPICCRFRQQSTFNKVDRVEFNFVAGVYRALECCRQLLSVLSQSEVSWRIESLKIWWTAPPHCRDEPLSMVLHVLTLRCLTDVYTL